MLPALRAAVVLLVLVLAACGGALRIPITGGAPEGFGPAFAARMVDQNGCPVERTQSFTNRQPIYVGFESSRIRSGTTVFARLSREGQTLADTRQLTADQESDTCVWFVFKPGQPQQGFQPGRYQADLMVNGAHAGSLLFSIQDEGGGAVSGGAVSGGAVSGRTVDPVSRGGFWGGAAGNVSGVQLPNLITTERVDDQGCPGDQIVGFRSNQPVYAAYDPFVLPAGVQMYALLLREQRLVETTMKITAEQDLHTCLWFKFDGGNRGGLAPGNYTVQIFIDGVRADSAEFTVHQGGS